MSGRPIDKIGAGSKGHLVDQGQGELIFFLYLRQKFHRITRITLGIRKLSSNRLQNMKEDIWKVA